MKESDIALEYYLNVGFLLSMPVEILIPYNPSKHVISEDFDHTNNYNSLKGEGSKKRKLEDVGLARVNLFLEMHLRCIKNIVQLKVLNKRLILEICRPRQ